MVSFCVATRRCCPAARRLTTPRGPGTPAALPGFRACANMGAVRRRIELFLAPALGLAAVLFALALPLSAANYRSPLTASSPETDALFDGQTVLELAIEVNAAGLETLRANSANRQPDPNRAEALATVREGTNIYHRVALHLKGSAGSFRELDNKPAFTLHFDEVTPGQRFHGLEKISLNNSVQDPTYMCEFLGRQLFNAAGVPVPRAGHALVTFNGGPPELYVLLEGWNKQFLKRHFPDLKGNFYEGAFRNDVSTALEAKSGADPENHADLEALVEAARETDPDRRFAALNRLLDMERFVTFVALEVMVNHWDGYSLHVNNYRIFHDRRAGKLVFLPHGMDQLFGVRRREFDSSILPAMSGLVAAALLETRPGRRQYLDRMTDLHTNLLDVPSLLGAVDKLERLLRPALAADAGARSEFDARVPVLRQRLEERAAEISAQLAELKAPPFNARGEASLAERNFRSALREAFTRRRGQFVRQFGGNNAGRLMGSWQTLLALDGGRYRFEARVRTEHEGRAVGEEAVILRSSVERTSQRRPAKNGWATVEHEFTLPERDYVSLIYEFGTMDGFGALDKSSLKLIRLAPATSPPP